MANNRLKDLIEEYKEYVNDDFIPSPSRVINLTSKRNVAYSYKYTQKAIIEEFEGLMELCVCILSKPTISKELFDSTMGLLKNADKVVVRLDNDKLTHACLMIEKKAVEEIRTNLKKNPIQAKKKVRDINLFNDRLFSKINLLEKKLKEDVLEG